MSTYYELAKIKIKNWFEKSEDWQKDLFVSLWNGASDESELLSRAMKFIDRAFFDHPCELSPNETFPKEVFFSEDETIPILLYNISDVKGVGAIASTVPLSFDTGLTIVYGENGCGKSSYVRILKAIENPECANNVISNVFNDVEVQPQARITFLVDGVENVINWTKASTYKYPIQIYDTAVAKNFVEKENEVIYEPKVLAIITKIVNVYSIIAQHYQGAYDVEKQKFGVIPTEIEKHPIVVEFLNASRAKDVDTIKIKYDWSEELESELSIIESSLDQSDPQKTLSVLKAKLEVISKYQSDVVGLYALISDNSCAEYLKKRKNQIQKKETADKWIKESRTKSLIRGFGEPEWISLWISAIKFSESYYNETSGVPKADDDICVLCQQHMGADALTRLDFFRRFINSTAITDSENANNVFKEAVVKLQDNIENRIKLDEIELELRSIALDEEVITIIMDFYTGILKRCRWLLEYTDSEEIKYPEVPSIENFNFAIREYIEKINSQIISLQGVINNRGAQEARRLDLISMRWINSKIDVKLRIVKLNGILKACKTNVLTSLKRDLSDLLITSAYIARFKSEISEFDIENRINVELISKGAKRGRTYHQVSLKGIRAGEKRKTGEILSEGEFRVVSLAAFLADLSSWNKSMPFVFDDPITSLDQKFEGRVAKRLISLSAERQVIVFTHRLAFAQLLNSELDEYNKKILSMENSKPITINNIELRKKPLGQPSIPNYMKSVNIKSAMNTFLNNDISKIKKAQLNGEYDLADQMIRALCSDFRSVIEQSVGQELLCGVISRFNRNVSTLKIPRLMAITKEDVELFHKMMSKYSCYEHSQAIETPISLPDVKSIEDDINIMLNWVKVYSKRCDEAQRMYS